MQITPDKLINFGLHSARGNFDVEATEVTYPSQTTTVDHGVRDTMSFMPSMLPTYDLGDDAPKLIATAVEKLAASGLFDVERTRSDANIGDGVLDPEPGGHTLFANTYDGHRTYQVRFTDETAGPFRDAMNAIHALRDAGLAQGRTSEGGAAGGAALL